MTDSPNAATPLVAFLRNNAMNHPSYPQPEVDYHQRFQRLDAHLNTEVHPNINTGATARDDGWLTDHGVNHITTVMRRASDLVTTKGSILLTPYEAFLLLAAIHFHDVGNVFGRDRHERQITTVMGAMSDDLIGTDGVEKRMIRDIAMAHGGYADVESRDKDTIGLLSWQPGTPPHDPCVQLLAALLRFADELADDHTRTNRFLLQNELLQGSEIYHLYADRLRSVLICPHDRAVKLRFEFTVRHATTLYRKGVGPSIYLYDEIVQRCLKMHRENIYCNRFMQPYVSIGRIDVTILLTTADYMTIVRKITFSLAQRGYPDRPATLREAAPDAEPTTGEQLHRILTEGSE